MKFRILLLFALLIMVSGPTLATLLSYNVSGNLNEASCADLNFDPKCGEFNAMFTINDEQTPTVSEPFYFYDVEGGMATLADGTVLGNSLFLTVRSDSAGTNKVADLDFFTTGGTNQLTMIWLFPDNTFDPLDIKDILDALENGSPEQTFSEVDSIFGNCNDDASGDCIGTVCLIEPKAVPEPHIIALLSLGLVGLSFTRRRMKA